MAAQPHLIAVVVMAAGILLHAASATTVYDVLQQNNLPQGLVPQGVQSYTLGADGHLEATLPFLCDFFVPIAGRQLKFRFGTNFGGTVQPGAVHDVYGVSFQAEYAWIGIRQVDRDGDQLTFLAQNIQQSFPVSSFAVSPTCSS
ncbi:uncharacterized protein LOC102703765 [Oryza brachyantha]|uniref:Legume lectin domain-containing protein n=1 Tax=Oryza brachyantha TaxID=4533 RepID=J3LPG3_ORYBR|nr:uncharacterized protein LOC102703765 [Oryza brachyantha]